MEAQLIAAMAFVSRQDVDDMLIGIVIPFNDAEEIAADEMDQETYQALIGLNAALVNHLITTARPLPRMVNYQFADVMPSLVVAYRLYADASRADEIVAENKIVHPLFCPTTGRGLSL
jgi:prophage DNA circulation protein